MQDYRAKENGYLREEALSYELAAKLYVAGKSLPKPT
jgi:hypothetical protein